jgi:hypothetical protein
VNYFIEVEGPVRAYLDQLRLTRWGHVALVIGYLTVLRHCTDDYREDRRTAPGLFHFDYLFRDGNTPRTADFWVDDHAAAAGVLTVVYAEVTPGALSRTPASPRLPEARSRRPDLTRRPPHRPGCPATGPRRGA